jgi:hypothetical protein
VVVELVAVVVAQAVLVVVEVLAQYLERAVLPI